MRYLLALLLACASAPEPLRSDPLPVGRTACVDVPPPRHRHWVLRPCGEGTWCLTDADARVIATEITESRRWAAETWESCRDRRALAR